MLYAITVACMAILSIYANTLVQDLHRENHKSEIRGQMYREQLDRILRMYNHTLRDPSHSELMSFIWDDGTDDHDYVDGVYECSEFSYALIANATAEGIRCGYTYLQYPDHNGHAIVAFDMTDGGRVYIDPQSDIWYRNVAPGGTFDGDPILDMDVFWCGGD